MFFSVPSSTLNSPIESTVPNPRSNNSPNPVYNGHRGIDRDNAGGRGRGGAKENGTGNAIPQNRRRRSLHVLNNDRIGNGRRGVFSLT